MGKPRCWRACSKGQVISILTVIRIAPRTASRTCSAACKRTASSPHSRRSKHSRPRQRSCAFDRPRRDSGFQFVDFLAREARTDGVESLTAEPYTVHSTINAQLQRDTEAALQEGLAQYEMSADRIEWHGPEANIADAVQNLAGYNHSGMPAWQLGTKSCALATLRCALDAGRCRAEGPRQCDPRRSPGWAHRTAGDVDRRHCAQPEPLRCRVCPCQRAEWLRKGEPGRAKAMFRRGSGYDQRCREPRLCWKTEPGASWRWLAAFPTP